MPDPSARQVRPLRGAFYGDDWWRHGIVYQIYPRSFADTDGDGIGDLAGIVANLGYLADLGVDAIWLSPIYPSPGLDVGYDVSDHASVDPTFGSEADFDRLVDEAHGRGIRVVLDLVMNHTSDQHDWFRASRSSRADPYADWYLWRDAAGFDDAGAPIPPNNWLSWFGGSAWQWDPTREQFYMHTFLVEQPDLNWRNPAVEEAQWQMVRGWLARGVDGFRLDVFNAFLKDPELRANPTRDGLNTWDRQDHIYDQSQPDFPDLIARFRDILDERPGRMSVGEMFSRDWQRAVDLTADRHLVFDWALLQAPWVAGEYGDAIESRDARFGDTRWMANVLSNHDQPRQASRLAATAGIADSDSVARAAAVVLLTIRGAPYLYYGEELGLRDVPVPDDEIIDPPARRALVDPDFAWWNRDLCRSPMPWTGQPGHGFTSGRPWLRFGADANTRNVAAQSDDPASILSTYRRLLALRRSNEVLRTGGLRRAVTGDVDVAGWFREAAGERVLVLVNFADGPREVQTGSLQGGWRAIGGSHTDPKPPAADGSLTLRALEGVILVPTGSADG